jgi:peptidoglycan/xylan/chitin deacetylase (PgdA/CDA1 family)
MFARLTRSSAVFLSSVLFFSASLIPVAHAATNLITNPSFEDGVANSPTSWTGSSFGTNNAVFQSNPSITGRLTGRAAQITINNYTDGDAKWVPTAVPVSAGQSYTFSFWYKSSASTDVFLRYNDSDTQSDSSGYHFVSTLAPAAGWTLFTTTFFIPAGVTALQGMPILASAGTLTIDDFDLELGSASASTLGKVSLTFDDGWLSQYQNALPILNAASIKATFYIVTHQLADLGFDGFMSKAQVKDLYTQGFEIGAHTRTHADLTQPGADLAGEIGGSKTDLEASDILNAPGVVKTFAYPLGAYNDTVKAAVASAGLIAARSVDAGYNTPLTDPYVLQIQHVTNLTPVSTVQGWIDTANANHTWLILMFHEIVNNSSTVPTECQGGAAGQANEECTSIAVLQGVVNYLASTHTCVLTVAQELAGTACGSVSTTTPDTIPPTITLPSNPMEVVATSSTSVGAVATFSASASDTNPTNPTVSCNPTSGSTFPLGNTTVTCSASDAANNTTTSTFVVHVTAPAAPPPPPPQSQLSITVPPTQIFEATGSTTTPTLAMAIASDTPDKTPVVSVSQTSFPIGTTTVTWSASDASTTVTGTSLVVIVDTTGPTINLHGDATTEITVDDTWSDPTTASDTIDGDLTASIVRGGDQVVATSSGTYHITYSVTDTRGNTAHAERTVIVSNPPPPRPVSSGGGGGGGGGGGVISGPLSVGYINSNGIVLGTSTNSTGLGNGKFKFGKHLKLGARGNDVMELHKILISLRLLHINAATGYFGPLTVAAIKEYQAMHSIEQVGEVGPKTRGALNGQ